MWVCGLADCLSGVETEYRRLAIDDFETSRGNYRKKLNNVFYNNSEP
jgi:hypothetical protein